MPGTPQAASLTVCGSLQDGLDADGWLIAALTTEWVGAAPRACREISCHHSDIQFFLPQVRILVHQPHRPPVRRLVPAFPGYLFVLPPALVEWHRLRSVRGIQSVLNVAGTPGRPYVMPAFTMHRLLSRASKLGVLEDISEPEAPRALPPLDPGTRCTVTSGPLEGQCGVVDWCRPYSVRVQLGGMGIPAILRRDQIEALYVPAG